MQEDKFSNYFFLISTTPRKEHLLLEKQDIKVIFYHPSQQHIMTQQKIIYLQLNLNNRIILREQSKSLISIYEGFFIRNLKLIKCIF